MCPPPPHTHIPGRAAAYLFEPHLSIAAAGQEGACAWLHGVAAMPLDPPNYSTNLRIALGEAEVRTLATCQQMFSFTAVAGLFLGHMHIVCEPATLNVQPRFYAVPGLLRQYHLVPGPWF